MAALSALYQCDYVDNGVQCLKTFIDGEWGYSILTQVPSPDKRLSGFACSHGQHQYCTWAHALAGNAQCLQEHLLPVRARQIVEWNANHPDNLIED